MMIMSMMMIVLPRKEVGYQHSKDFDQRRASLRTCVDLPLCGVDGVRGGIRNSAYSLAGKADYILKEAVTKKNLNNRHTSAIYSILFITI